MRTNAPVPAQITWPVVMDWHASTPRREGMHIISTFIEEARPQGISWLLAYLWAAVRTQWFTAKCVSEHGDYGNLGGHYTTYRASVRDICIEFAKYDDTAMCQDEDALLAELKALVDFALKTNPNAEQPPEPPRTVPVPLPPPPAPKPEEPKPEPEPAKPEEPGKAADWSKVWKMALPVLLVAVGALIKMFAPGWVSVVWNLIAGALGG